MAKWAAENRLSADWDDWDLDCRLSPQEIWNSIRSPLTLTQLDLWKKSLFRSRSSALSCDGLPDPHTKRCSSSHVSQSKTKCRESDDRKQQQADSRLAPDGAPLALQRFDLQASSEEKRTELSQRKQLQETHNHMESQTDLLKGNENQFQHSHSTTKATELKNENLTKSLNTIKQQKQKHDLLEICHCTELQDKILQLEKNIMSIKLDLECRTAKGTSATTLKDNNFNREGKSDLHQRVQNLELQLKRAGLSEEAFSHVCNLQAELDQTKSQANQQQQNAILLEEELRSTKKENEKLLTDLTAATERLQPTLQQLHQLEAEKVIHTNQIAELESERMQLISEKEELMDVFDPGDQKELRKLQDKCFQLSKFQEALQFEKKELETLCRGLELKVQNVEADYKLKEQQLHTLEKNTEQEKQELRKIAAHWNERWLDAAMELQSTRALLHNQKQELDEDGNITNKYLDCEMQSGKSDKCKSNKVPKLILNT